MVLAMSVAIEARPSILATVMLFDAQMLTTR